MKAHEIVLVILGSLALIALNLLWIFGINGEIRATAISFDIAVVTLFLNWIRKCSGILGGSNNG